MMQLWPVRRRQHTRRYLAALEAHQARYGRAGDALYRLAMQQITALHTIIADDALKLTPATLGIVAKALLIAGDLEAHALRIDVLLAERRS